jgi:hypothetical protein
MYTCAWYLDGKKPAQNSNDDHTSPHHFTMNFFDLHVRSSAYSQLDFTGVAGPWRAAACPRCYDLVILAQIIVTYDLGR